MEESSDAQNTFSGLTPENGDWEKVPTDQDGEHIEDGISSSPADIEDKVEIGNLLGSFTESPTSDPAEAAEAFPNEPIEDNEVRYSSRDMTGPDPLLGPDDPEPVTSTSDPYEPPRDDTPPPTPPRKSDPMPAEPPIAKPSTEPTSTPLRAAENWLQNVDPRVLDLIYWRCPKKTGAVFGSIMFLLLSLSCYSLLSVASYLALAVLTVTFSFRIYKNILAAVQKSQDGHPFKQLLDLDITLSEDRVRPVVSKIIKHINCTTKELHRLFLVEDIIDSVKFGLLLWVLTYVGGWFNGMTLVILGVVAIFTLPKVYDVYKIQIDHYVGMAIAKVQEVIEQIQSKLPFLKRKQKTQ